MRALLTSVLLIVAGVSAYLAGPNAFGRAALFAGLPSLAVDLLDDPVAKGVALYRMGDYRQADDAFRGAGRSATYDRGLSLAALGDYALSVAYFDAVLFADPADADARFNRERVAERVDPVVGVSNTIDGVAANVQTEQSDARPSERDLLGARTLAEQVSVMDPRVARMTAATTGWLERLSDEPGIYLKRRIRAEYERRQDLGLANPPEDTAW